MCNDTEIVSRSSVAYLGLTLEQLLMSESIAAQILAKCASKLKFLYCRTRPFDFSTKKLTVLSLIQCHFDYACSTWFSGLSVKLKQTASYTK